MLKKIIVIMLALSMLFVAGGCGNKEPNSNSETVSNNDSQSNLDTTVNNEDTTEVDWPKKPIQIIVGANAGGGIDTAARLMAKYLEKELDATIVVSNMSGGAGSIAATKVKDSKPDGYTMLVCHEALLTNKISGVTEFDYDAFESGGIALKVFTTCLLSKEYETFEELVTAAKENPGKIKFGTEIATNDTHIIAMMEKELGAKFTVVDSGAIPDQVASMMGGHIDFMKAPLGLVKDYVDSGEFHLLGYFNEDRNPDYPDIPTMKENGVPFIVDKFFYCAFPKGTDPEIIEKFSTALENVSQNPEFIEEANKVNYSVDYVAPEECGPYFEDVKTRLIEYQNIYDEVMGN